MTTVIADRRRGILLADRRVVASTNYEIRKIHRIRGCLVGFAGDLADAQRAVELFAEGRRIKKLDCALLLLSGPRSNRVIHAVQGHDGSTVECTGVDYLAIGSGAGVALGAMDAGATAERALAIASKRDDHTGPEFDILKLDSK